jgi:hypothetical protein
MFITANVSAIAAQWQSSRRIRTFAADTRSLHRSMPDVRLSTAALTSFRAPSEP